MLAALTLSLSLAPAQGCEQTLSGRVLDEATAEAIATAEVTLRDREGHETTTTTDRHGQFTLAELCPGPARLEVSRADYASAQQTVRVEHDTGPVSVSLAPREVDVLDDMVVTAPARERRETAASQTIEDDELDSLRGQGLADALATIPGVSVLRNATGGLGKPIIRGHVGRRNVILYDRVRHESQKWGLDHAPEIDPFSADSITVIKGAGAIRYGPDAIGGVVLLDPPPLPSRPGVTGEVHLVGFSNGLRGTTAMRVQGAHAKLPGLAWRLEANALRGGALITPDYPLDNTASRIWNAGGSVGYARRGFSIRGTYQRHSMHAGIFTGTLNETPSEFMDGLELDRPRSADLYERGYEIERAYQAVVHQLGLVRARAPLGRAGDLVATYALQTDERDEFERVRRSVTGPQLEFDLNTHAGDVVFEQAPAALGSRASLEGEVGASYVFRDNRYDGTDPAFLPDYRDHQWGLFALQRVVFDRVEIEGGARYDGLERNATVDDQAFLAARAQERIPEGCTFGEDVAQCRTPFHAGTGSLGLLVRPVEEVRDFVVRLDANTAVRFPNADEQYIKGSAPSLPALVNGIGWLSPERTWGGTLTVSYAMPWLYVEGSAYASYIDDYIYFRAVPQDDPRCGILHLAVKGCFPLFEPLPVDALFYGGELTGRIQPPKWPVSIDAQAGWVRAQRLPGGEAINFIPPDRYQLEVTYHWPELRGIENGHVGVEGTFVARQRHFEIEEDFAEPPPAYALLGASAGFDVPFRDQRLMVEMVGRNLTNTRYRDYTNLLRYFANEPGWDLSLRLTMRFAFRSSGP